MTGSNDDLSSFSLMELFRAEVIQYVQALEEGLVALEDDPSQVEDVESLMRAAHSIKGAARIVGLHPAVDLAHAMEDVFVAVQAGHVVLSAPAVDAMLAGTDVLRRFGDLEGAEVPAFLEAEDTRIGNVTRALRALARGEAASSPPPPASAVPPAPAVDAASAEKVDHPVPVSAASLSRLLAYAGESVVAARRLTAGLEGLEGIERWLRNVEAALERVDEATDDVDARLRVRLDTIRREIGRATDDLTRRHQVLRGAARQTSDVTERLYREVLAGRMRPFRDALRGFPRLARDLSKELGKDVRLVVQGKDVPVDRDVLEQLDAPLNHLVRNALDHGLETPEERGNAGKERKGTLRIEARHRAGMLDVVVADDGRGIDPERVRARVIEHRLIDPVIAKNLGVAELLDFLFLPGFSTADAVSQLSGRGVGLDAVQQAAHEAGGMVRAETEVGRGMRFTLTLPITRSVIRAALVEIGGDPYAFPLARTQRLVRLDPGDIHEVEGRQQFIYQGHAVGLVLGHELLGVASVSRPAETVPVVILEAQGKGYGVVVDRFLGEQDLVVRSLDPRLGRIPHIDAASQSEDGVPLLIVDTQDLVRSIDQALAAGRMRTIRATTHGGSEPQRRKRVLVVDDSITVREVERNLLKNHGYEVDVAVDGAEALTAVQNQSYDLVLTDVDMPRMNGIRLTHAIKEDPRHADLPVLIVSYKDREEDKVRGLEAGAEAYLTKSSFHDETLLQTVRDLIGEPLE